MQIFTGQFMYQTELRERVHTKVITWTTRNNLKLQLGQDKTASRSNANKVQRK